MQFRLGLYEKAQPDEISLSDKLVNAKAAGYDSFELSIDETDGRQSRLDWPAAERCALRLAADSAGIPIETMCLSGHRKYPLGSEEPATARCGMDMLYKAVELSCDLGIRIIQLAGYDVYYEPSTEKTIARFTENLLRCVEFSAAYGVTLGFETMECVSPAGAPILDTISKSMKWVKEINSPWLQVYPDIGNITNACGGKTAAVLKDIESGRGHIAAAHLKETVQGVFRDLFPGEGRVDFLPVISALKRQGVRKFTAECWARAGEDNSGRIASVNRFYRKILEDSHE